MCCWQWPISKDSRLIVQNWRTREPPHVNFFQHGIGVEKKMEKAGMKEALANRSVKKTVWGGKTVFHRSVDMMDRIVRAVRPVRDNGIHGGCVAELYVWKSCVLQWDAKVGLTTSCVWHCCCMKEAEEEEQEKADRCRIQMCSNPSAHEFHKSHPKMSTMNLIWQFAKMTVIWHKICFSD